MRITTPIEAGKVRAAFRKNVLRPLGIIEGDLVSCVDGAGVFQGISVPRESDPAIIILLCKDPSSRYRYSDDKGCTDLSGANPFTYRGYKIPVRSEMYVPGRRED